MIIRDARLYRGNNVAMPRLLDPKIPWDSRDFPRVCTCVNAETHKRGRGIHSHIPTASGTVSHVRTRVHVAVSQGTHERQGVLNRRVSCSWQLELIESWLYLSVDPRLRLASDAAATTNCISRSAVAFAFTSEEFYPSHTSVPSFLPSSPYIFIFLSFPFLAFHFCISL